MSKDSDANRPEIRFRKVSGPYVRVKISDAIYTVSQIAMKLQVKTRTVRWWLSENRLKGFKVGRLWRVREEELLRFMNQTGYAPREEDEEPDQE